ncbi:MAG: trypsin-like peptidase domain-containing protein [bacterium]|nr:trypsin-like peptidase domain-containing protein [bacterium]
MLASTVIVHGDFAEATADSDAGLRDKDYCSGVVVSQNGTQLVVATARHCTTFTHDGITLQSRATVDAKPTYVKFHDGDRGAVDRVVDSSTDDLALLYVTAHHAHPAAERETAVALDEQLYILGAPFGYPWTISEGYAAQGESENAALLLRSAARHPDRAMDPRFKEGLMLVCSGCGPGDSGAGAWNASGRLVGIEVAAAGNYSLMVPVRRVYALLAGLVAPEEPRNSMIDTPGAVEWVEE